MSAALSFVIAATNQSNPSNERSRYLPETALLWVLAATKGRNEYDCVRCNGAAAGCNRLLYPVND